MKQVFQGIFLMPQISSSILGKMSELFIDLFEGSRDLLSEDDLRPRCRSSRLKPQLVANGTRRSAKRNPTAVIKHGVEKGNNTNTNSDYVAREDEDNNGSDGQSKSSKASDEELGTESAVKEVTLLKRSIPSKVS
jgi:hypothetical protein